jgi:peroxiredoxin
MSPALAVLVPLIEIVTAVGLIPKVSAFYGGVASFVLLSTFNVLIAWNLIQGRSPECHCFGALSARPIDGYSLLRNALLSAGSLFVIWNFWPGSDRDIGSSSDLIFWAREPVGTFALAVGVVLAAQSVFIAHLLSRAQSTESGWPPPEIRSRISGLQREGLVMQGSSAATAGGVAPDFNLPGADGGIHDLGQLLSSRLPVILIFTQPGCSACQALMPEIQRWTEVHASSVTFALVSAGNPPRRWQSVESHVLSLHDDNEEVHRAYGIRFTPSSALISAHGTLEQDLAVGTAAIRAQVAWAATHRST